MIDISLIVPSYHKQPIIVQSIQDKIKILESLNVNYQLIIVIDGDVDNTLQTIKEIKAKMNNCEIKILSHPFNQGKGRAIKTGIENADGNYIGFIDADLDINSEIIFRLYTQIQRPNTAMVFANKYHQDSTRKTTLGRKLGSLVFATIIKGLFHFPTWDTQTGAKMFTREFANEIIKRSKIDGFAFDVEIFKIANQLKFNSLGIPVHIQTISPSTLNPTNQIKTIGEIINLRIQND